MSYSNGGGTLTLPSPTHVHHVDITSTVRSIRRSLSRSPSKYFATKSPSSSPQSPLSPSPLSPPKRANTQPTIFTGNVNPPHTPSPLAVPFPPSAKLALRSSARSKTSTTRPNSRTRTSPKSPMKRALSQTSDNGNGFPSPLAGSASGQENSRSTSPTGRKSFERPKMSYNLEVTGPVNQALSRLGGDGCNDTPVGSTTSSPLKRSDAIMNLDQASLGSPVAKRRSLHGSASFGHDFNVFDHGPAITPQFEIHDDSNHEYELSTSSFSPDNSSFTSMPRRSSSLRKSTLQQRHGEKTSWGRRHAAQVLAAQQAANAGSELTSTPVKNRPRLSLDQFMPPMVRESPFQSQGSLPSASVHVMNQPAHQPHPLSRTMTTSSSSSSFVEDSPTHVPVHFGDGPRPKLDFSKSLPAGSLRPFSFEQPVGKDDSGSFSTPKNYKAVKPLPAAFMSTGLISKVNRNPEQEQVSRGVSKGNVPDTPCKKQSNLFATYPPNLPGSAIARARHIRHSFGNPSTPFNPHGSQGIASIFGKGTSVFGGAYENTRSTRRGSFLSVDGDDSSGSPDAKGDSQISGDFDLPPTPTKQVTMPSYNSQHNNGSPSSHRGASGLGFSLSKKLTRTSSKLNVSTISNQEAEDSDVSMDMSESPTTSNFRFASGSFMSMPSFHQSRKLRSLNPQSPTPLLPRSLTLSSLTPKKPGFAKFSHVVPASPLERIDFLERLSPRTPQDNLLPPDPSGLSISNHRDGQAGKSASESKASMLPPATPTTGREYFPQISDRRLSMTPISNFVAPEIDESLSSRFEKVELIGTGAFSQVYRVTQPAPITGNSSSFFFGSSGSPLRAKTPPTPMPERVFAVKKSRQPYQGIRDREGKLQEVNVLKALGHSDHVVHLIDSWEEKNFLYIQTEFCEEGSLDLFLAQVGRKGRLDDFRIWKIMLELGLGLKHIHDSGYIHLDLKPANILITFEGVLKIADFGMATSWPAPAGIEGEGDREYIGPEILEGIYDKPSDIFALGLIMLEIAGNVQLPENGPTWMRLRSGDMSDVPSLTFSNASTILRDATGIPLEESDVAMEAFGSDDEIETGFGSPSMSSRKRNYGALTKSLSHDAGNLFGAGRRGELNQAPDFMTDMYHEHALDRIVHSMILPKPQDRPTVHRVLESQSIRWVESRRRAGATVFEGNWGPADDVLADDAEMMDV
ncbi:hypothetical protein BGZ60DRAFT_426380 [Tricladium varicosporioides]|nr:hypothetical protein BGZ60DRAFT_426380 [Hymenoscyphus varicosporioides]